MVCIKVDNLIEMYDKQQTFLIAHAVDKMNVHSLVLYGVAICARSLRVRRVYILYVFLQVAMSYWLYNGFQKGLGPQMARYGDYLGEGKNSPYTMETNVVLGPISTYTL